MNSKELKTKRIFQILQGIFDLIQFIHLKKALGQILGHFWEEITKWHFHSASKEDIWPKKI